MGMLALVFPGQGAQFPGMGLSLYRDSAAARRIFDRSEALRPGTLGQCFEGTKEELAVTVNTQPCLFAVETAAAAAVEEAGIRADMAAGFSLGELSALAFAGAADFDTMFSLVNERAGFMQEAAVENPACMAAVLKLQPEKVTEICSRFSHVYPVNFNCPGNISVAGSEKEMEEFRAAVRAEKGRAVPIAVSGGFHSPFMSDAAEKFARVLEKTGFNRTGIPVYADSTGLPYPEDEESVRSTLAGQISSPVLWEGAVRAMIEDGADTFIEVGPGETLIGMIRRINKDVRVFSASDPAGIEKIKAEL